ncbi:hypothetical protein PQQ51_01290 [Paraburkholderia xenovorans]|uniref:hypothetical protein n=1 Tax=Paraburkholderia xenovorans TaxID=36873 RepID=UPI0038BC9C20
MTSRKSQNGAAGVLIRFLAAFALLLVAFGTNAKDCFELYSDSGATPGSKTCRLDVVGNTPGGMANYARASCCPQATRWVVAKLQ